MLALKPSLIRGAILEAMLAMRPAFIFGPPGIGKSSIVRQITDEQGMELRDVRCALLDPVDLRGLPMVDPVHRVTAWAAPDWWPTNEHVKAGRAKARGAVFFDELNTAPPSVQSACLQAILDRRLGEARLADGWVMLAAGNQSGQGTTAQRMSTALGSRFIKLEMAADLEDWCKWALAADVAFEVIAFLRSNPQFMFEMPAKGSEDAFPTLRTWEFVSDVVNGRRKATGKEMLERLDPVAHALIAGCVGSPVATQFAAYMEMASQLPSIDAILVNPADAPVPDGPSARYCLAYALAMRMSPDNIATCLTYLDRLPTEYNVLSVRAATDKTPGLTRTKEFVRWAIKHSDAVS